MVLVRERRHQRPLRLPLPLLHLPSYSRFHPWNNASYPLPILSSGPNSPTIETLSDLEKLEVLGRGNGGTVYKVQHIHSSSIYALKVIRFEQDATLAIREKAVSEAEILKQVDSEFVVRCYGVFDSGGDENGELCFLMEYMEGGSLNDVLHLQGSLSENVISNVAKRVLEGLSYLHGLRIVHRDIKPSNLLINSQGEVKIADFGVSRVVLGGTLDGSDCCEGTCAYMSPERLDSDKWVGNQSDGFAGDIWALGLALLECYVGHFPLVAPGMKPDWATLICAICFVEPEIPKTASSEFRSFISMCLEKDWRRRGTVTQLLTHPFVAKYNYSAQEVITS